MSAQFDGDSSSVTESRRGSADSEANQNGDVLRDAIIKSNGHNKDEGQDSLDDGVALPFGEGDAKFTLRTKGLRERR